MKGYVVGIKNVSVGYESTTVSVKMAKLFQWRHALKDVYHSASPVLNLLLHVPLFNVYTPHFYTWLSSRFC